MTTSLSMRHPCSFPFIYCIHHRTGKPQKILHSNHTQVKLSLVDRGPRTISSANRGYPTQQAVTPGTDITHIRTIKIMNLLSQSSSAEKKGRRHNVRTFDPPALSRHPLPNSSQGSIMPSYLPLYHPALPAPMSLRSHPGTRCRADTELCCSSRLDLLQVEALVAYDSHGSEPGPAVQR